MNSETSYQCEEEIQTRTSWKIRKLLAIVAHFQSGPIKLSEKLQQKQVVQEYMIKQSKIVWKTTTSLVPVWFDQEKKTLLEQIRSRSVTQCDNERKSEKSRSGK